MPQGVTNAPSTFQRLMEQCMGDLQLREVLLFLDDSMIFSESSSISFERIWNKTVTRKVQVFPNIRCYLGHIVSEKEVDTHLKINTIKSWPIPTNLKELHSFLAFAGNYRHFIKDYSTKPPHTWVLNCMQVQISLLEKVGVPVAKLLSLRN